MAILYRDERFLDHQTGLGHPESPARLRAVHARLDASDVAGRYARGVVRPATLEQLARVHAPAHLADMERVCQQGGGRVEADTVVSRESHAVAIQAAGAATAAVDEVLTGRHQRACCLIRPPGHHALAAAPMGFCLFNNVAVAARHAQAEHRLERVLIVDWDVHHGNGTQDIFYDDETVFFFSSHRHPFYPGTGTETETGTGRGLGTTFNLPLDGETPRREFLSRFETMLGEAAGRSRPELILISAGFDAHREDPVGSLGLESEDFRELTRMVVDVANTYCGGKVVSLLEGGYNVARLAESVEIHLEELARE